MQKLRPLLQKLSTPISIMLVPHTRSALLNIRIPLGVLGLFLVLACVGFVYTASLTYQALDYYSMKRKYTAMSGQMKSMQTTIHSLKQSEQEFKRLFSLGSKKQVLDAVKTDAGDGSIDVEELQRQIKETMASVSDIKSYLAKERDTHFATPQGWPVAGKVSSGFGMRRHPQNGRMIFHSGIDLSAPRGVPVHATADGIVSFADWSKGSGKVVVIEHGKGFTTVYAHNSRIDVKAGETVKRGDTIALTGASGNATGPHVHYEVWKDGRFVNPASFISDKKLKTAVTSHDS